MSSHQPPPPDPGTPDPAHATAAGPGSGPAAAQTTASGSQGDGRPPLRRPREGRILAGVAAGLADHLGWDVALVRLLFVVGTLLTQGLGVLAYIAAAVLIPAAEPGAPRPADRRTSAETADRPPSFWLGVSLLVLGGWWLLAVTPIGIGPFPGVSLGSLAAPLLLIAVGLALWVTGERAPATTASTPPTPSPPTPSQETTMQTTAAPSTVPPGPPTPPAPAGGGEGWNPPPAPDRGDSVLGRATVGLMLVTLGVLWTLRLAGVLTIGVGQMLAAALLVVGLGLLVGAVAGRSRGLVWLGVILLPFVLVAQVPGSGWTGVFPTVNTASDAVGEVRLVPTDLAELESSYELGAGSLRLDLTELPLDGETVRVELSVGVGEIRVIVPDDVDLTAEGSVGIGEVRLLERSAGGLGVGDVRTDTEVEDPRGEVELELSAGLGEIRVDQAPAPVRELD